MAKIIIGGLEFSTGPLKFKQLKKAFPLIKKSQQLLKDAKEADEEIDPIVAMENAIQIIAFALERENPEMTAEKIEEDISLEECAALNDAIVSIVTESGFEAAKPGEGLPAKGEASPSTETLTA
jgi:hypothetical protein